MKKYNKVIIWKYINGYDIPGYDIDELENDKDFILQVMDSSKDIKFYNMLNEEAKNDPEVILHIIKSFENERSFLLNVVGEYIKNNEFSVEDEDLFQILIEMDKNHKVNFEDANYGKETLLHVKLEMLYGTVCEIAKKMVAEEERYDKDYVATGFVYMELRYENNKVIKDYLAKRLIEELFGDYDQLDRKMHCQFKTPEIIEKKGIRNYIINELLNMDSFLGKYASCNINVITDLELKISKIIYNWDASEYNKTAGIYEFIDEYYDYKMDFCEVSKMQLYKYLAKELNMPELIDYVKEELEDTFANMNEQYYYNENEYDIDDVVDELDIEDGELPIIYVEEELDYDKLIPKTKMAVDELIKEIKTLFRNGYIDGYEREVIKENKEKSKIIKFPIKND